MSSFLAPPEEAFTLPVRFAGCACCPETECVTRVDHEAQEIHVLAGVCPDPCDCDGCDPLVGACEIPPLARGMYTVVANGEPAFTLPVEYDSGLVPPPNMCATYARPDECSATFALPGESLPAETFSQACANTTWDFDTPASITLTHDCWPCEAGLSVCNAILEERLTDDLPPGGEIRLDPRHYITGCFVSCTDECIAADIECEVPALVPGDYYRVWIGDEMLLSFTARPGETVCAGRDSIGG